MLNIIKPPVHKSFLLCLANAAHLDEQRKENESETDRMKRLLIKSTVESITENILFHAKLGNLFYVVNYLNKELILDIYDNVKLNFPDCKIYLNINECNMVIHWG